MPSIGLATSSQPQQHAPGPRASGAPLFMRSPFTPSQPEPAGRPRASTRSKHPQRHGAPPKSPAERPRRRPHRPRPAHLAQTRHRLDLDRPAAASISPHRPPRPAAEPSTARARLDHPRPPDSDQGADPAQRHIFRVFPYRAVFSANRKTRYDALTSYSQKISAPFFQRSRKVAMMRARTTPKVFRRRFFSGPRIPL